MTAGPSSFRVHVAYQVLAMLAEAAPMPLSTPQVQDRTGYGVRYGQLVYQVLTRLAAAGQVERSATPGVKPVYWRRLTPQVSLPPLTVRTDREVIPLRAENAQTEVRVDEGQPPGPAYVDLTSGAP